jgi:hypothetical protein
MKQIREYLLSAVLLVCVAWSATQAIRKVEIVRQTNLLDFDVNSVELVLLSHLLVVVIGVVLIIDICLIGGPSILKELLWPMRRPVSLVMAAIACTPSIETATSVVVVQSQELPANALLSPSIAAAALRDILKKRREQVRNMSTPTMLSDSEQDVLLQLVKAADSGNVCELSIQHNAFPKEVQALLIAVDRTVPDVLTESVRPDENWSLVLQVFGYPRVMNRAGEVAHFEKKRALELVTWMALNRERSRRSAARTAMWDDDVADATFSTVVSAMRRGLGAIDNSITATDWAPPTYSDELLLNSQITTDENLIAHSLRQFRADARELGGLMAYLPWVRDVPFAGTAYSWADLDGTTTRLVILALTASREVATWAVEHGDMEALGVAVSAGLRVMPGDEELLGLQSSFLQTVREAGAHSVA